LTLLNVVSTDGKAGIWYAAKRHRIGRVLRLEAAIPFVESLVNRNGLSLAAYISLATCKSAT